MSTSLYYAQQGNKKESSCNERLRNCCTARLLTMLTFGCDVHMKCNHQAIIAHHKTSLLVCICERSNETCNYVQPVIQVCDEQVLMHSSKFHDFVS